MNGFIKITVLVVALWGLATVSGLTQGMGGMHGMGHMGNGMGHHMMGGGMQGGMGGNMQGGMHGKMMRDNPMHQQMYGRMVARQYGSQHKVKKSTLMKELFATDLDGDKRISPAEYQQGPRATDADRFNAMDGDADGFVTLDEMVAAQQP